MTGIEYIVLHVQDPILYVIRKQHRISPTQGILICNTLVKISFSIYWSCIQLSGRLIITCMMKYKTATNSDSLLDSPFKMVCVPM